MKATVIFCMMAFLASCNAPTDRRLPAAAATRITIEGVIDDHYQKNYPYAIRGARGEWALDVITVPASRIGVKVRAEGRQIEVQGVKILTEVEIEGVRLQTEKEWAKSTEEDDPFSDKGALWQ